MEESPDLNFSDPEACDQDFTNDNLNNGVKNGTDSDCFRKQIKMSTERSTDSSSEAESDYCFEEKTSCQFQSISPGLILKATYEHGKRNTEIMCENCFNDSLSTVTYNERMRLFVILDSHGITTWKRDAVEPRVLRALVYPNYEYRLITNMVYAKKYNCYFVLGKDFSLKVCNKDFVEMCSVCAEMRSVMFMLFNPVRDQLITGGVGGTQVWDFHQQSINRFGDLKTHGSNGLTLKYELPSVGGGWVKHVELDHNLEHLYCCSDHDLYVYDLEGNLLFKFERIHSMSITGCRYSKHATVLVTSSLDSEVKVWSLLGGLVHIFRGHSRAITNMILHPATSSIVVTCSLDGTVRMWSLDTMDCLSSVVVSVDGIQWMGLTDDNFLYLSTPRAVTLWNLNYNVQFWALVRSPVTKMVRCGCKGKTTRVVAISDDNSVRIMARSNSKNLTTVLPPPNISPLQRVMSVCYSREFSIIYLLINPHEIWVYTARTDPACRIAVWHMTDIQKNLTEMNSGLAGPKGRTLIVSQDKPGALHKATENRSRNEGSTRCFCVAMLTSAVIMWTSDGYSCPIRDSYLLVGLEDGRILFMDPVIKGERHLELKTGKDPVVDMCHDSSHSALITVHKLKGMMRILVWCVPDLTLQHELFTAADLKDFVRESTVMMTGHECGCVIFHTLEPVTDSGHHTARNVPIYEELMNVNHKPEHLAPVTTVDVCAALKIFCSSSEDGVIKIWYEKVLLTEIILDSSLSAVCFLNNRGDLLVGYQKHIFYIDHTKVCPQLKIPESDVDSFDKESYICEDPAVLYEGVAPYHDQVTLENYLVPFDIEFSKDFLEGRVTLEPETEKEEVSDDDGKSQISRAPSEIYMSAESTPQRRLSHVDLILGSEVSRYDLLKHMKKTLDQLAEKEFLQQKHPRKMGHQPNDGSEKLNGKKDTEKIYFKEKSEKRRDIKFCFPRFGKSPGPTPESSRSATPEISPEAEEEHKEELSTTSKNDNVPVQTVKETNMDNTVTSIPEMEEKKKPELKATVELFAPRTKFGLADVKVDVKDTKKVASATTVMPQHRPDPEPLPGQRALGVGSRAKEKSATKEKTVKKKMMSASQRKNTKVTKAEKVEKVNSNSEPPTHIYSLGLTEMESDVATNVSLTEKDDLCHDQNEIEVPIRIDKELETGVPIIVDKEVETINSLASKLGKATMEDEELASPALLVPALPCVPLSESGHGYSRPSTSKSRSVRSVKRALQSVPDFHDYNNRQESKTDLNASFLRREISGASEILTADSVDGDSIASSANKNVSTSKTGLLFQDKTEIMGFGDKTLPQTAPGATCQTPAFTETPDHSCERSTVIPDLYASCQVPITSLPPISAKPEVELRYFRFESLTEPAKDFNKPEKQARSSEKTWQDRDLISVPICKIESPDEYLDNGTCLNEHSNYVQSGSDLFTQTRIEVLFPTSEMVATETRSQAFIEDRMTLDKPELENVVRYFKQRPHTAHNKFSREDLQAAFEASMIKYKQLFRSPVTSDKLYNNDDLEFSENWHERQIQRHMLLRMQTEIRALNIQENQQVINHTEQTYLKQYITEGSNTVKRRNYNAPPSTNQRPSTVTVTNQRARTVPSTNQRASTVHGNRSIMINAESTRTASRPHTVGGFPLPEKQSHHSATMLRQIQPPQDLQTGLWQLNQDLQEKTDLRQEKPFRCRLQQVTETRGGKLHLESDTCQIYDPRLLDPRNPHSVRPRSSKSIPSKCYRYVLVTRPRTDDSFPLPTALEKYLIAVRFPQEGRRLFKRIRRLLQPGSMEQTGSWDTITCSKVRK